MLPLSENELDAVVTRERERDRGSPLLTDWDSLSARLRAEGLIQESVKSPFAARRRWIQVAAGLALMAGGAAVGRVTAGAPVVPTRSAQTSSSANAAAVAATSSGATATNASLASATPFKSPDEAWEALNRAGEEYQRASAYLSATNTEIPLPQGPDQYRTRLAALDNVMSEMRDALKEAPQDPVINQYYLATVGAREATLRQLGTTLPASARLNRF